MRVTEMESVGIEPTTSCSACDRQPDPLQRALPYQLGLARHLSPQDMAKQLAALRQTVEPLCRASEQRAPSAPSPRTGLHSPAGPLHETPPATYTSPSPSNPVLPIATSTPAWPCARGDEFIERVRMG